MSKSRYAVCGDWRVFVMNHSFIRSVHKSGRQLSEVSVLVGFGRAFWNIEFSVSIGGWYPKIA